ncbi:hypothetical protein P691DRAFT_830028 [Macrolepiota fuliginosa MF-IS2]|uniref:F-box domain-containing protein n=1 Tax=Macrolepiota fuliginosa MF-IS2 TaxID=1400762 RepID=A0A9P6BZ62_9AGAR|nr:hypothetical protein P691DRAFT_830028 [Macrolepiota fuliginosa MF-IS2]
MFHTQNGRLSRPATIEKLPLELLHEIFLIHAARRLPANTAQVLCSVCWDWRNLTLQIPDLWTNVVVHGEGGRPHIPILAIWSKRSGDQPLHISIWNCRYLELEADCSLTVEEQECYLRDVFKILCPQIHRWQSFTLSIPPEFAPLCDEIPMEDAVMLKYVNMDMTYWDAIEGEFAIGMLALIPALRSLTITEDVGEFDGFPELYSEPWGTILGLDLGWERDWEVATTWIIHLCTSALWMKLDSTGVFRYPDNDLVTILPNLRLLSISGWSIGMFRWIYSLDCPKLSIFHVFFQHEYELKEGTSDRFARLVTFLGGQQHNIRSFKMEFITTELHEAEMIAILKACLIRDMPSVEVQVGPGGWENRDIGEFFRQLTLAKQQDTSLSKLRLVTHSISGEGVYLKIGWSSNEAQAVDAILEEWDGISRDDLVNMMPDLILGTELLLQ